MRLPAAIFAVLLCAPALAQGRERDVGARCRAACLRVVDDARTQNTVCARCGLDADPTLWLTRLPKLPDTLLADDDWLVRWGTLKARAQRRRSTGERELAAWVSASAGEERERACLTALHVAGNRGVLVSELLKPAVTHDPSTSTACLSVAAPVRARAEVELYATEAPARLEALTHLSTALGLGTARVVLDAMATRPKETDDLAANLLVAHALAGGPPAGLALLRDATLPDTARVDRLLEVYARVKDRNRPLLASPDKEVRREAVHALGPIAPLSSSELALVLADSAVELRMSAARALAAGEGRTVSEAARARLDRTTPASPEERRRWLELLGEQRDPGCPSVAQSIWQDEGEPDALRAQALESLVGCGGPDAYPELERALHQANVVLQAAAVRGAARLPRDGRAHHLLLVALESPEPLVLTAALDGVRMNLLRAGLTVTVSLLEHPDAAVRIAAHKTLAQLDGARAEGALSRCLGSDAVSEVREACADALGDLGGGRAVGALLSASRNDSDVRVKLAAAESLRKLGVVDSPRGKRR